MKRLSYLLVLIAIFCILVPVKAANSYSVVMVTNTSNNKTIGTYSNYKDAVSVMNKQNSTSSSVASVYKNGKIINSRYAIFRLKPNNGTVNLYQNAKDYSAYTYTRPSSMTDTAFIDSNESRVQIMLNGFKGFIDINAGDIVPISLLGSNGISITASGLRLRSEASTSSSVLAGITCTNEFFTYLSKVNSGGYTWYKINYNGKTGWVASGSWLTEMSSQSLNTYYYRYSSGNLLHRYAYHNGTSYTDYFTNLGPTPTYLTEGVHYYSFDGGIYLYNGLISMLDDYRNNTYNHSVNSNNPNYPYYLYLPNRSVSKVTAGELDKQITNTSSKLYGQGKFFKEAESLYGMNALSAFATAKNESASGTSKIAMNKNNVFGFGASDSCPYDCAYSYGSVRDSIIDYAKRGLSNYMSAQANYYFGTHAGNKGSGRNVKYASDPLWGETQAAIAYSTDLKVNKMDYLANTIGVTKYGKYSVPVYKDSNGNQVIYKMENKNSSFKVYNIPVTVIDKVGNYYKIYSDNSSYQYGYIKVDDLYVSNNQPVINVSDKTIQLNSNFNVKDGVSATDKENGNLTNRIKIDGSVDSSKTGVYSVKYTVTDDSNFSVSKTIKVSVVGISKPVIEASDKSIKQNTDFDYLDGVKATDEIDGDITSKITYSKSVDVHTIGTYEVTYSVSNSMNVSVSKTIKVTVNENNSPLINVSDKIININDSFDALDGVKAFDKEDGDITSLVRVIKNDVNNKVAGDYSVTYEVTDSDNNSSVKTIKVVVSDVTSNNQSIEKELKPARYYFDYLKKNNNKLEIKGYNAIVGIDNSLNNDITYEIVLEGNNKVIKQKIDRITNKNEMTRPVYTQQGDNNDYSYSWFKGNIDIDNIPDGDYTMYIVSSSSNAYSKALVNNLLLKDQVSTFTSKKTVTTRNNYYKDKAPLELIIRSKKIADKTANGFLNQYTQYRVLEFNGNNLHIGGTAYSQNMNLAASMKVNRKIIFEDQNTYEKYVYDLGSITNGLFKVGTTLNDHLDKTRAWFDANLNITNIPKGTYTIYISTSSNISDYSELNDVLMRNVDKVKMSYSGKSYSFGLNKDNRYRVELNVK